MAFRIRFTKRRLYYFAAVILVFLGAVFNEVKAPINTSGKLVSISPTMSNYPYYKVIRVIDGDTIELENKVKVRYIGINSPELHDPRKPVECFAREAYEKNKLLVEGKNISLVKDISETDRYGRLLRYVYLGDLFINDYLVREGFAQASTFPPDVKFSNQFMTAQAEAQLNNRGLWSSCQSKQK